MERRKSIVDRNVIRIAIFGDSFVGKTTITRRLLGKDIIQQYEPTVHDFHEGSVEVEGKLLNLEVIDTSGKFCFPSMRSLAMTLADLCVVVYSFDNKKSLESVNRIVKEIIDTKGVKNCDVPILILGNKVDLDKTEMTEEYAMKALEERGFRHVLFSAKYTFGMTDLLKCFLAEVKNFEDCKRILLLKAKDKSTKPSLKKLCRSLLSGTK